jgi:acyl-CoA synthetase (NDP forming)
MTGVVLDGVAAVISELRACRPAGAVLAEPFAQEVTESLGIGVPSMVVVPGSLEAARTGLPGERVVVKVVGPPHKTDLGGVRVVENTPADIAAAVEAMAAGPAGGDIEGFLVAEFVDHDPAREILAGVRWSEAFGPVVTVAAGGVAVGTGPAPLIVARATADRLGAGLSSAAGARSLVEGFRGGVAAADPEALMALVALLLDLGEAVMPHDLLEYEINPLVFGGDGPIALDALAILGWGGVAETRPARRADGIQRQLHPGSIAVMGVSERMNPGRMILRNVLAAGFPADRVVVMKPGADEIDGCRCVPDPSALDEPVDLLVLAIAAEAVPGVMEEVVASAAARSVVLIPGGLGERPGTEAAAARVRAAVDDARLQGRPSPVVTGPNSMGIRSVPGRFDATFIPRGRMTASVTRPFPVAVVAQSGAFTLSRLDRLPWLQPRYVVTVGNQLDLTIGDYLEHFAADPDVGVVACYLEGFAGGDGDRALRAAGRIRDRGGTVLWYRGGRTPAGTRSAASHTAAVATDDVVARSLGEAAGILEAGTLDDFDDLLRLAVLLHEKEITGARLAVISNAGFECVAAADALGDLTLAELSPETSARLETILEGAGLDAITGAGNPLDLTPIAGDEPYAAAVEAVLDDEGVDLGVVGCVPFTPALQTLASDGFAPGSLPVHLAALVAHPKPWVAVIDGGRLYDTMADHLEEEGVPVIRSMDRAVRLLGAYAASRGAPGP